MRLLIWKAKDRAGREFEAYRFRLSDGSWIEIDREIADAFGEPEVFCTSHVRSCEAMIDAQSSHLY